MHRAEMYVWVILGAFCAAVLNPCTAASYVETGTCKNNTVNLYVYNATERSFGKYDQTFELSVWFKVYCVSVGNYSNQFATLYEMYITKSFLGGNIVERTANDSEGKTDALEPKGWMRFVQVQDGSIPLTFYSREEDHEIVNIKKAIVSVFQGSFDGAKHREESDPQSKHNATYSTRASIQDLQNGVIKMTRRVTSSDVIDFSTHIPEDEVNVYKEANMNFNKVLVAGSKEPIITLTSAQGTSNCSLMPENNTVTPDSTERDSLENEKEAFRKRAATTTNTTTPVGDSTYAGDPNNITSYDDSIKTNEYKGDGNYTLQQVGTQRMLRQRKKRSIDMNNVAEDSLLAFINQTRKAIERMVKLYQSLGDIVQSLEDLHRNPNNSAIAHNIQALVKLEAQYGPQAEFTPAIDDVLDYFETLVGSNSTRDRKMRFHLYFIMSTEGSLPSQLALVEGLESTANVEEKETLIVYISMITNPHPRIVAKLESLISSDVHSSDPLLLAYGAILAKATPELQRRMTLFLINRLPRAETNSTSLIHHILSLGNTASPNVSTYLVGYLGHPNLDVQLTAIFAMRFLMSVPLIQVSLKHLLSLPDTSENHIAMISKSLLYGVEQAKIKHQEKPYSNDLADALVLLAITIDNEELHSALSSYLKIINTQHSLHLLQVLKIRESTGYTRNDVNSTRYRRGTTWDEKNSDYDIVESYTDRLKDTQTYQHRISYIWGKKFGGGDINAQVAAGGFAGVANSGSYKLFGHAIAKLTCYDYSLTVLEFLVLREKSSTSTLSRLYANVMGNTVKNIDLKQDAKVCMEYSEPLYEGKQYTIFDFTYSIFVVVGTLNFHLVATSQFTTGMYVNFCEDQGKVSLASGLSPTLTFTVSASGDLEIALVAKAGITLAATFSYQLTPEVTSEFCYKNAVLQAQNCLAVYHQWDNNKLELYVWYAWRGWCGWWACTGKDAYKKVHKIDALSFSWDLPSTGRMTIWKGCDNKSYSC